VVNTIVSAYVHTYKAKLEGINVPPSIHVTCIYPHTRICVYAYKTPHYTYLYNNVGSRPLQYSHRASYMYLEYRKAAARDRQTIAESTIFPFRRPSFLFEREKVCNEPGSGICQMRRKASASLPHKRSAVSAWKESTEP
jgi:hypothetical protein